MSIISRFALRNVSLLSASQIIELFTGLLYSIIVVRILGPVTYGQLLIVISAGSILDTTLNLNVENPLTSRLRKCLDEDDVNRMNRFFSLAVILTALSSTVGLVALFTSMVTERLLDLFTMSWLYYITIYFVSMEVRHFRNIIFSEFQATQLYGNLSYLKSLSAFSLNFIPLLYVQYGIEGICWGYLSAELFILGSYLLLLFSPFGERKATIPSLTTNVSLSNPLVSESWSLYQAKVVDRTSNHVGYLMIPYFAGPKALSFFNVGEKFFKFNVAVFPALKNYLLPRFTQKWYNRRDEFFYTMKKYLIIGGLYTVVSLGTLTLLIPYLIPAFFGNSFRPSILVFYVLVPGYLVSVPQGNIFREVSIVTDNVDVYRLYYWISTVLFLALLPLLTHHFDYMGAAAVYSLRRFASGLFILYWFYLLHHHYQSGNTDTQAPD